MKRTGPTNVYLRILIRRLRKAYREYGAPIWKTVAEKIDKPRRKRIVVNVGRINRYTSPGDVVVVPGKVLGAGTINHPVMIAAISFSRSARDKVLKAGGRCLTIEDLIQENPKGSGVKIIG